MRMPADVHERVLTVSKSRSQALLLTSLPGRLSGGQGSAWAPTSNRCGCQAFSQLRSEHGPVFRFTLE